MDENPQRDADNILTGWEWPILPGKYLYLDETEIGDFSPAVFSPRCPCGQKSTHFSWKENVPSSFVVNTVLILCCFSAINVA